MGHIGPQGAGGANARLGGQGMLGFHLGREGPCRPQGGLGARACRTPVSPHKALGHPGSENYVVKMDDY